MTNSQTFRVTLTTDDDTVDLETAINDALQGQDDFGVESIEVESDELAPNPASTAPAPDSTGEAPPPQG